MEFTHKPVMLQEVLDLLKIRPQGIYVDGTAGGGGHAREIAKRLQGGRLIAIDQDPDAVQAATAALADYNCAKVVQANFTELARVLAAEGLTEIDGLLLDLGVSSYQLDTAHRGFSYHNEAPLDMRMSRQGFSAEDLVNTYSEQQLSEILFRYAEERYARRIAHAIVKERGKGRITTTLQLVEIIKSALPAAAMRDAHPARRTFQAIRIAVNDELNKLSEALDAGFSHLRPGGRLAVITFHSLEDRLVKTCFAQWAQGCVCPPDFPVCVCGKKPLGKLVAKGTAPSREEIAENLRSRSAKLRVVEKCLQGSDA